MELDDIQGLLVRGHVNMDGAEYLMLNISDGKAAQGWLRQMLSRITHANVKPDDQCLQVAFTWQGLEQLGMHTGWAKDFRSEFIQGLNNEYRARILGDIDESDSNNWQWGGPRNEIVHIVLMHFAVDEAALNAAHQELEKGILAGGMKIVARLDTYANPLLKEHFGFRDGISQPIMPGLRKKGSPGNPEVPVGEFIMGYQNAHHELPDSPAVPEHLDRHSILPQAPGRSDCRDLGKNGSYMVFRQLRQDVKGFWKFAMDAVQRENPDSTHHDAVALASKMVGRWPGGAPLTMFPEEVETEDPENDFTYNDKDLEGFRCPIGSHVRRTNPRDSLLTKSPEKAMTISKRHRILRRGRIFGAPLVPDFDPRKFIDAPDDGQSRGLHFICFNTNIAAQFEFIQHTWTDNTKFQGMYEDPDPVLGIKDSRNKAETHDFTVQAQPLRRKVQGLSRQVHVMGGAYFFMPGLRALRFLSDFTPDAP
jgi:Dyp-type peroxidase family